MFLIFVVSLRVDELCMQLHWHPVVFYVSSDTLPGKLIDTYGIHLDVQVSI
jgi:hypothetical protein